MELVIAAAIAFSIFVWFMAPSFRSSKKIKPESKPVSPVKEAAVVIKEDKLTVCITLSIL